MWLLPGRFILFPALSIPRKTCASLFVPAVCPSMSSRWRKADHVHVMRRLFSPMPTMRPRSKSSAPTIKALQQINVANCSRCRAACPRISSSHRFRKDLAIAQSATLLLSNAPTAAALTVHSQTAPSPRGRVDSSYCEQDQHSLVTARHDPTTTTLLRPPAQY